jgi:glycosyltransferase involved in cell wall biosynthesis
VSTIPHLPARARQAAAGKQDARPQDRDRASGDGSPTVSVVIPTRDEAGNIAWVLNRLPPIVDEVVIVDGLSTDETTAVARAARPDVVVVLERRPGKGAALQAGFAAARGDIIVMLDADCSMDPAEVTGLVGRLRPGVGLVKGSRFMRAPGAGTTDMTPLRRLGNGSLLRLVNRLNGVALTDLCYGLCAFRRSDLADLSIDAKGFEVETQIVLHALRARMSIEEVPSYEAPRHDGASKLHPCRDGIRVLRTVARERRAVHRRATQAPPAPVPIDERSTP